MDSNPCTEAEDVCRRIARLLDATRTAYAAHPHASLAQRASKLQAARVLAARAQVSLSTRDLHAALILEATAFEG